MKKLLIIIFSLVVFTCITIFSGCTDNNLIIHQDELASVEQVGKIPDAFKNVVEKNLFYGITAFDGRLLKAEIYSQDKESKTVVHRVRMMDEYGKELAFYTCSSDDAYHINALTVTEDGGFLFVLGFEDYAYEQNVWASDKGVASRVIKCDKEGNLQFDTSLNGIEGSALRYCFEKNGRFYFFGTIQTSETKTKGVYSPTDIYMVALDNKGIVLKNNCIAGSDYDSLDAAEIINDVFLLSVSSQSEDGYFAGSNSKGDAIDWVITVNDDLEMTKKKKESGRDYSDLPIGEKDGISVYKSDALFKDFDAGTVNAFIDYGDSYLIVSENSTGVYEKTPPMISSIWYYTETVYSLYDYNGKMIFRASVDSSPDYDKLAESLDR